MLPTLMACNCEARNAWSSELAVVLPVKHTITALEGTQHYSTLHFGSYHHCLDMIHTCVAALLGVTVITTDLEDPLRLLQKNVDENSHSLSKACSACVRELTWGENLDKEIVDPLPDFVFECIACNELRHLATSGHYSWFKFWLQM